MGKHEASGTADTKDTHIGKHRETTEVRTQGNGWAVGRGVSTESVTDHTRNS